MNYIWKINENYILNDYCICSHCYKYIKSKQLKKILKKKYNPPSYKYDNIFRTKLIYNECYICQRFIEGIVNGPIIDDYIENSLKKSEVESSLLLLLNKITIWYYHHPIDYFGHYLKDKFNLNHNQVKNIYQAIQNLYGLPSIEVINKKADDLYLMLKQFDNPIGNAFLP
jgi:hypothetical protein